MRSLVTGAAGFIGSNLCEHLLAEGDEVVGLDCLTENYAVDRKLANIAPMANNGDFTFHAIDVRWAPLRHFLEGVDVVYHLAGQPGVRASWGQKFETYVDGNIVTTQRLLEECAKHSLTKFVYASSSSVYGDAECWPTSEDARPQPVSPYGVTKLAGEHLSELYRKQHGIPTASLRFFTVYGPRQRPDMALSRLVTAALSGAQFELYGDGTQSRDFTYVGDIVRAVHGAALSPWTGVANIGGGATTTMREVIDLVTRLAGTVDLVYRPAQAGDVRHTAADTTVAREGFGYRPVVPFEDGLKVMVDAERRALLKPAAANTAVA